MNTQVRMVLTEKSEKLPYYFRGLYLWADYSLDSVEIDWVKATHISTDEALKKIYDHIHNERVRGFPYTFIPDNLLNKTILKTLEYNGYDCKRTLEENGVYISSSPIHRRDIGEIKMSDAGGFAVNN